MQLFTDSLKREFVGSNAENWHPANNGSDKYFYHINTNGSCGIYQVSFRAKS